MGGGLDVKFSATQSDPTKLCTGSIFPDFFTQQVRRCL